jgi:hypothetical protein
VTERIHSITLVLREDMREDDAQQLMDACRMFGPVLDVKPNVSRPGDEAARSRLLAKFGQELDAFTDRMMEVKL